MKNLTKTLFLSFVMLSLVLTACIEQETIIVEPDKTDSDASAVGTILKQDDAVEESDLSSANNPDNQSLIGLIGSTVGSASCKVDSDCGEDIVDNARCWQKSVYTRFNQSSCIAGKCKITQYESITEICNDETETCNAGSCVPKPKCYQRGDGSIYSYTEVSDGLGNKYGNYCETNLTLTYFFCNPEVPEKIFNESISCSGGCRNGKCNPDQVVLNELSQ